MTYHRRWPFWVHKEVSMLTPMYISVGYYIVDILITTLVQRYSRSRWCAVAILCVDLL